MGGTMFGDLGEPVAATAECVDALARNRGLRQIPVRGTAKAFAVLLLFALAHNMMRAITLLAG